ncbi:hypothetical protein PDUR_02030 [Paenibacillus durus]|uniref:YetF-like N-terminal transmembrane domain-containing protein n=2 Tax=Paenibacillus durus TaxID=44251 RepID=A0A089HKP8_PAEDU|nr:hypothetical protein PDUR_02030 [Paenibacillus durus]
MDYKLITIKRVTGFVGLWIMARLLGKKRISQLTPFDFVSAMMLSEIVGNMKEMKRGLDFGQLRMMLRQIESYSVDRWRNEKLEY